MVKRPTFKEFKKKSLQDPVIKREYEALDPEFELLDQFIRARKRAKLSQVKLAESLNAQQPAIARLENGGYANTSINNLTKIANALGCSLHVTLRPAARNAKTCKADVNAAIVKARKK
jgi:transcriptional regulator with XRE-family HTH domain